MTEYPEEWIDKPIAIALTGYIIVMGFLALLGLLWR